MGARAERFTKATLAEYVRGQLDVLRKEHGFDNRVGWAQVDGKGEAVSRAFGEWYALQMLADAFDLAVPEGGES